MDDGPLTRRVQGKDRPTPAEGQPPLGLMVGPIVEEVTALAQRPEVSETAVAGGAVEVGGGEHGANRAQRHGLQRSGQRAGRLRPSRQVAERLSNQRPPRRQRSVALWSRPQRSQRPPVRRVEGTEFSADWHIAILATPSASENLERMYSICF